MIQVKVRPHLGLASSIYIYQLLYKFTVTYTLYTEPYPDFHLRSFIVCLRWYTQCIPWVADLQGKMNLYKYTFTHLSPRSFCLSCTYVFILYCTRVSLSYNFQRRHTRLLYSFHHCLIHFPFKFLRRKGALDKAEKGVYIYVSLIITAGVLEE